jgi:dihydroflavonol-4-reductase
VHTASPVPAKGLPKDENVLIRPAVEGTLAVLRAAHKHRVKRVVITSSLSAVLMKNPQNIKDRYDESDWSDLEACSAYDKSKTMAERAAWEFLSSLPEDERFELVSINPVFILGPSLVPADTSTQAIKYLMQGKFPFVPKVMIVVVDIRECALAHLRALTVPGAKGKRFIIGDQGLWIREVAQMLKEEFPNYSIKSKEISYCPIKLASIFSAEVKLLIPMWRRVLQIDNRQSREVLGIEYRDHRETLRSMGESLIKFGAVPDKRTQ